MIVPVLAGCAAGGPGTSSACACCEVAFVLVLTGALVWAGWFASASQNATWIPVLITIAAVGGAASAKRRSRMSRSR